MILAEGVALVSECDFSFAEMARVIVES